MGVDQELLILLLLESKFVFLFSPFECALLSWFTILTLIKEKTKNRVICEAESVHVRESVRVFVASVFMQFCLFDVAKGGGREVLMPYMCVLINA